MATYLLAWRSNDPRVTTSLFANGILQLGAAGTKKKAEDDQLENEMGAVPQNVTLIASYHVIGEARGYVILKAKPEEIHQLILALPPGAMDVAVNDVIEDAEARAAMQTRSSGYKLK